MVVPISYFYGSAVELAPDLIGKSLCRYSDEGILRFRITETECYCGEEDSACHAHRGKTPRNAILYEAGGRAYVYLCYGLHHLLNLTTGAEGHPEAVLIRGVARLSDSGEGDRISGPGRVTRALRVDKRFNTMLLSPEHGLWVEDDGVRPRISCGPRVGIDYASEADRKRPWRFFAAEDTAKRNPGKKA